MFMLQLIIFLTTDTHTTSTSWGIWCIFNCCTSVFFGSKQQLIYCFLQYILLFSVLTTSPVSGSSCYRWKYK